MSGDHSHDHQHEHRGTCGGIENRDWIETKIDRRKLEISPSEHEERAQELERRMQAESDDGGFGRRSFMGKAAGVAAAGAALPAALSDTANAHGIDDPVFTTTGLNIREGPSTGHSVIKTAAERTPMIVEAGPYSNDGYRWWRLRVNGCENSYGRVTGYAVEEYTDHGEFGYGTWGQITSVYGDCRDGCSRYHQGVDVANDAGTAIHAARSGTVSFVGESGGFGNLVIIDHGGGYETYYAHLSSFDTYTGATVSGGERIGYMGCTGNCSGPHLHFEIRVNGTPQDWKQVRNSYVWLLSAVPRRWGLSPAYPTYPY